MKPFAFARPSTPREAIALAGPGSAYIAGGTELLNWCRRGIAAPDLVIDLGALSGLDGIEQRADGGWRIGALIRLSDLAANRSLCDNYPVLTQAILRSASPQLRNLATLGGSLLQATRCPYFRAEQELPCNKRRPGSGCSARHGLNESHAIFGWTDTCVATQPSDTATALVALDAVVTVLGLGGERQIQLSDFHALDADEPGRHNVLDPGEMITVIDLPAPASRSAYIKVQHRAAFAFATVSAAVCLELRGNVIKAARIVLGSVAYRPWRLERAERTLEGCDVSAPDLGTIVALDLAEARPLTHNSHKVPLARQVVLRAIAAAAA